MIAINKKNFDPYIITLILIFVINALIKWRFFNGLVMADDFTYGLYSYSLFRIPLPWNMDMDFRALRFTLLLPVAVLFRFLPPIEFVAVLYPLLLSFGTLLLVFLIGRKLYGPIAGIFAALILTTFPADMRYGTMLLPDIIVSFFVCLAVWAFLNAESEAGGKTELWYLLSGFSVFLAFNARENSYYFLMFFLPFIFNKTRWKKGLYMVGLGFAIPVLILYLFYYFKSGDFLYNLHLAQKYRDTLIQSGYIPDNVILRIGYIYFMFQSLFQEFTGIGGFISEIFGLTFILGVPCLMYTSIKSLKKRNWKLLIIPWWFLIGYLILEFGSISFVQYQMMKKLPRFLLIITPALAICCGVVFSDIIGLWNNKNRKNRGFPVRFASSILIIMVLFLQLFVLYFVLTLNEQRKKVNMAKYSWAYNEVLKDIPHKPVFGTGGWWFNRFSFYYLPDLRYAEVMWKHSEMLKDLREVKSPSELAGSYVIIDRSHFTGENDLKVLYSYDNFGNYLQYPPPEWKLLASKYIVEIYEVPSDWKYREPDGKEIAFGAFRHAMRSRDLMLAIYSLHPDFVSKLGVNQFRNFITSVMELDSAISKEIFAERVRYKQYNGKWKLSFILD